jgi:hypothetical protein
MGPSDAFRQEELVIFSKTDPKILIEFQQLMDTLCLEESQYEYLQQRI